jgi:prepilin-type N-terminal cleavage/methylation domain-containing protein
MKIQNVSVSRSHRKGFTLVEMIGVLAIIAILASLLVPRVFAAINDARVNAAVMSYNTARSAAMIYFGKYGRFGGPAGVVITDFANTNATSWDRNVLLTEGLIERSFTTRVATTNTVELVAAHGSSTVVAATNAAYNLDNNSAVVNDASGGVVVLQAVLAGVSIDDARDINRRIDGDEAAFGDGGTATDLVGRVKYGFGASTFGTVRIYIADR